MSFTGLLRHRVTISRRVEVHDMAGDPEYDERGQPITTLEVQADVRTRIEQLTAREVALLSQAGVDVGDYHLYFLANVPISTDDQIRPSPADGRLFEVQRIEDLGGAGRYQHVYCRLVTSSDVAIS